MSKDEQRNVLFILEHRDDSHGADVMRYFTDLYWDTVGAEPKTHSRIEELLKYHGDRTALQALAKFDPPKLPVNGRDLQDVGVGRGPQLAIVLNELRLIYKQSNYTVTHEQLLEKAKELKESLPPPAKVTKGSKKSVAKG